MNTKIFNYKNLIKLSRTIFTKRNWGVVKAIPEFMEHLEQVIESFKTIIGL